MKTKLGSNAKMNFLSLKDHHLNVSSKNEITYMQIMIIYFILSI